MTSQAPTTPDAARASRAVVHVLAAICGLEPALFFKETRGRPREALARQIAMGLMHTELKFSHSDVGPAFGRDRTTARLAATTVENLREEPAVDAFLTELGQLVQKAYALRSDWEAAL